MSALLLLFPSWVRLALLHGELPVQESLLRASRQLNPRERQMVVPSSSQISLLFRLKGTREKNDLTALGPSQSILLFFIAGGAPQRMCVSSATAPLQRLRLAIARATLRDAPILILDDPTANLDVESEVEFLHALDKLISRQTVLLIARRLSTLGKMDEILVFKDGSIVEQGTYQDLKQKGGEFARLLAEQNRYRWRQ